MTTVIELKKLAKDLGIPRYYSMKKDDLIKAIKIDYLINKKSPKKVMSSLKINRDYIQSLYNNGSSYEDTLSLILHMIEYRAKNGFNTVNIYILPDDDTDYSEIFESTDFFYIRHKNVKKIMKELKHRDFSVSIEPYYNSDKKKDFNDSLIHIEFGL